MLQRKRGKYSASWHSTQYKMLCQSIREMMQRPLTTFMTVVVVGIAICLPLTLYALLNHFESLSHNWRNTSAITIYLKKGAPEFKIQSLLTDIRQTAQVKNAQYISPAQGLSDFEALTHTQALSRENNPIPGVITITPVQSSSSIALLHSLSKSLTNNPIITSTQGDTHWMQRLNSFISIGHRVIGFLSLLFGIGVICIIGNTVRLTIEHRVDEMFILRLIGATDGFISRPIVFNGALLGLLGGILAWLLVSSLLWWIEQPIESLTASYGTATSSAGLPLLSGLIILFTSSFIGWACALIITRNHLKKLP